MTGLFYYAAFFSLSLNVCPEPCSRSTTHVHLESCIVIFVSVAYSRSVP